MKTHLFREGTTRPVLFAGLAATVAAGVLGSAWQPVTAAPGALGPETANQRVTNALARALRGRISSPGGKPTLVVRPTNRASQGYFSEILIAANPAQVKKLRFSEMTLKARNVRIDVPYLMKSGKVKTLASQTSLRAVVTETDLQNALAQGKHSKEMGIRVKFMGDRVRVTGNWKWSWFNGPVEGIGKLQMAPGHKVNFAIQSLKLNGREVPQFVKDKFSERVNPVVDYEDLPFRPPFKTVRLIGNKAVVTT